MNWECGAVEVGLTPQLHPIYNQEQQQLQHQALPGERRFRFRLLQKQYFHHLQGDMSVSEKTMDRKKELTTNDDVLSSIKDVDKPILIKLPNITPIHRLVSSAACMTGKEEQGLRSIVAIIQEDFLCRLLVPPVAIRSV